MCRPFGAPAEDVFNSEVAVLVAAGIGVTVSVVSLFSVSIVSPRRLDADLGFRCQCLPVSSPASLSSLALVLSFHSPYSLYSSRLTPHPLPLVRNTPLTR